MKKIFSFITILFLVSFPTYASQVKGMIIRKTDTLNVMFIIPFTGIDCSDIQYGIKYIDNSGNKVKLKPSDAKEVRFEYESDTIRMLSRFDNISYNSDGSEKIFLKLEIDGTIKLFSYFVSHSYMSAPSGPGGIGMMYSSTSHKYVLQKGYADLVQYSKINFKDDLPVFLKKCPDLVKMIQNKVYIKSDIERIINYYNYNCGSN